MRIALVQVAYDDDETLDARVERVSTMVRPASSTTTCSSVGSTRGGRG